MPDQRSLVTLDELSAWFTERVAKHDGCAGTKITVKFALQQPDADGCNWSEDVNFTAGPDIDKAAVIAVISKLMPEARRQFNVR
jgi:hypothetical protein